MNILSTAEELLINTTVPTYDYGAEAIASYDATGNNMQHEMQLRFEATIKGLYDSGDDMGGLCVYYAKGQLTAAYDYENYTGWVFQ